MPFEQKRSGGSFNAKAAKSAVEEDKKVLGAQMKSLYRDVEESNLIAEREGSGRRRLIVRKLSVKTSEEIGYLKATPAYEDLLQACALMGEKGVKIYIIPPDGKKHPYARLAINPDGEFKNSQDARLLMSPKYSPPRGGRMKDQPEPFSYR
ncbi:MAG: hypothetical protein V1721_03425 [Pseudomonadota bacterium]